MKIFPYVQTTFIDFDFVISTDFKQSGWSDVMHRVTIFNTFASS